MDKIPKDPINKVKTICTPYFYLKFFLNYTIGGIGVRMQEVKIPETGIIELDIMELPKHCFLVISEREAKIAALPSHSETSIVTYKGMSRPCVRNNSNRF